CRLAFERFAYPALEQPVDRAVLAGGDLLNGVLRLGADPNAERNRVLLTHPTTSVGLTTTTVETQSRPRAARCIVRTLTRPSASVPMTSPSRARFSYHLRNLMVFLLR